MASSLLLSTTFTTSSSSFKARTKQAHGFRVSCKASPEDNINENQLILPETQKLVLPNNVDRRNLLVGFGGLYTAANVGSLPSALAVPITTPDSFCQESKSGFEQEGALRTGKCCPPNLGKKIQPFKFPSKLEKTRVRWPAHKGSKKQVDSYKKAIQAIRDLPDDHPHSFLSQAKIHCAYCNGGYTVDRKHPETVIDVHNSWLFLPFHRWYLYFYERILRKYSGDDDFALPYWNWDNPEGMTIPPIFVDEKDEGGKQNPLYDVYRNQDHLPPAVVNLFFSTDDKRILDRETQIACNLSVVYRDLTSNATDWKLFFGGKYTAPPYDPDCPDFPSAGSVETSHNAVHIWVGQPKSTTSPNGEDMGNFYSAAYDPLFYVHHANVDRMWKLWRNLRIPGHKEPPRDDWLNASYVFYDENLNRVRVYNKDSVKIDKLKYDFEESKTPWKNRRPAQRKEKSNYLSSSLIGEVETVEEAFKTGPMRVDPILKVSVKRPATNRTPEEKKEAHETLRINGIQFNSNKFVKFDVFVSHNADKDTKKTPCDPEFAGSFAQVPHGGNKVGMLMPSAARFGLDELLEDTKTEDKEYVVVALVARAGCEDLTVSGIEIKLEPILY